MRSTGDTQDFRLASEEVCGGGVGGQPCGTEPFPVGSDAIFRWTVLEESQLQDIPLVPGELLWVGGGGPPFANGGMGCRTRERITCQLSMCTEIT